MLVFSHSIIVTWVLEAKQSENGIYINLFTKLVSVSSPSHEPHCFCVLCIQDKDPSSKISGSDYLAECFASSFISKLKPDDLRKSNLLLGRVSNYHCLNQVFAFPLTDYRIEKPTGKGKRRRWNTPMLMNQKKNFESTYILLWTLLSDSQWYLGQVKKKRLRVEVCCQICLAIRLITAQLQVSEATDLGAFISLQPAFKNNKRRASADVFAHVWSSDKWLLAVLPGEVHRRFMGHISSPAAVLEAKPNIAFWRETGK
ncbi:hypothetical protein MJT46_015372 [Ovis ammon polii x Ovis aries]|nr:hypothetical protein MJT46_015372 [Ovis ammon polii x Ovis aries]